VAKGLVGVLLLHDEALSSAWLACGTGSEDPRCILVKPPRRNRNPTKKQKEAKL
jgi:hypothetical protein